MPEQRFKVGEAQLTTLSRLTERLDALKVRL